MVALIFWLLVILCVPLLRNWLLAFIVWTIGMFLVLAGIVGVVAFGMMIYFTITHHVT